MADNDPLSKLISCLAKLPGVGRRSAERMALRLVGGSDSLMRELIAALQEAEKTIACCSLCGSVTPTSENPCRLCVGKGRDDTVLCVVEEPSDIVALERSGGYRGRYHALRGRLSPMRGEGPNDLRLRALLERVDKGGFNEVILALSTDVEGDSTANFIAEQLRDRKVRITRLASGLPAGSGIMYSDPVTLAKALKGRVKEETR